MSIAPILCLMAFPALLIAAFWFAGVQADRRAAALGDLARSLEDGVAHADSGWFSSAASCYVSGRHEGREVRLFGEVVGSGDNKTTYLNFEIAVPHSIASFEVSRANAFTRFGARIGLMQDDATGNQRVDEKYRVRGRGEAAQVLGSRPVEGALDDLFESGVKGVSLEHRLLRARKVWTNADMDAPRLMRYFIALTRIARECERRPVTIRVKGAAAKRFAWTGGARGARCPFCRDELDPEASDVEGCKVCDTLHHDECLKEAGGCTVLGCRGSRAARVSL